MIRGEKKIQITRLNNVFTSFSCKQANIIYLYKLLHDVIYNIK